MSTLLAVRDLAVVFDSDEGAIAAVDGASFEVRAGEILGLVGESGSGKSVTAFAILKLIRPPGRIVRGEMRFEGVDLARADEETMRAIRGGRIALIPQSPRTSLNPLIPVGRQIARLLELHQRVENRLARQRTLDLLARVGIAEPERRGRQYAHQLSGGTCQRVMIAMALASRPLLLLADEPTTGLDVSVAARILELLRELGRESGAAIVLITHDLGAVAQTCDRVAVMHAGQLVESADVRRLFKAAAHPYSRALLRSIPRIDRQSAMEPIPGAVPSMLNAPPGCRYADRCPSVMDRCRRDRPAPQAIAADHVVACFAIEPANAGAD